MKKGLLLGLMVLMIALLLSGCKAPEPEVEVTPSPSPSPTQEPTPFVPTAVPTITPRPMRNVEWPADPEATLIPIDPTNKPTPVPLAFGDSREYESNTLNVKFKIPAYLGEPQTDATSILFAEPSSAILSGTGVPATFYISVSTLSNVQTIKDAENELGQAVSRLRDQYAGFDVSSTADNPMMGEDGKYVTFWLNWNRGTEESPDLLRMQGRILVVPKDRKLYTIQFMCPSEYYRNDYMKIFRELRSSFAEL